MANREDVIKGLAHCIDYWNYTDYDDWTMCDGCPYNDDEGIGKCEKPTLLFKDAIELLKEQDAVIDTAKAYENGEYDVLDLLSSAWYGKQYYFRERNGMIYSRATCQYMTLDDAITEFANRLGDDGSI